MTIDSAELRRLRDEDGVGATEIARRVGLAEPYTNRNGILHQDAITVPLLRADGAIDKRNAYYRVPGLTQPAGHSKGWMKDEVAAYYGDRPSGQKTAIVVEGMKDLWRLPFPQPWFHNFANAH